METCQIGINVTTDLNKTVTTPLITTPATSTKPILTTEGPPGRKIQTQD